jgi:hypothetical protein
MLKEKFTDLKGNQSSPSGLKGKAGMMGFEYE